MKKIILCFLVIILSSCASTKNLGERNVAEVTTAEENSGAENSAAPQPGVLEYLDCKRLDNPAGKFGLFRNYKRISDNYELENIGFGIVFNSASDCSKELRKVYLEDQRNKCK